MRSYSATRSRGAAQSRVSMLGIGPYLTGRSTGRRAFPGLLVLRSTRKRQLGQARRAIGKKGPKCAHDRNPLPTASAVGHFQPQHPPRRGYLAQKRMPKPRARPSPRLLKPNGGFCSSKAKQHRNGPESHAFQMLNKKPHRWPAKGFAVTGMQLPHTYARTNPAVAPASHVQGASVSSLDGGTEDEPPVVRFHQALIPTVERSTQTGTKPQIQRNKCTAIPSTQTAQHRSSARTQMGSPAACGLASCRGSPLNCSGRAAGTD